jgi:hypothetical protein
MRKVLPLVLLVFAAAPIGTADDVLPVKDAGKVVVRMQKQTDALASMGIADLFQQTEAITTATGMKIAVPAPDVLIARMGADGKIEHACVNNAEAALAFASRTQAVAGSGTQRSQEK